MYHDIYRTSERGFQLEYDLHSEEGKTIFECKRLKGVSWNQLLKIYEKMPDTGYRRYLLFQSNFQPCLVFYKSNLGYTIRLFEDVFEVPFEKHESTRRKKVKE